MMKKMFVFLVGLCILVLATGCTNELIKIGILQYAEHDALTEARNGFIDGLKEEGFENKKNIKINILNPQSDNAVMATQSKKLVRSSDLLFAIATPAAVSLVNEARVQKKSTPILFTAVTDPVGQKLIESNEKPGGNVTGTNDLNPIKEQIDLIKVLLPNATKLGIIYTSNEANSELQANIAKQEAEKQGLSVEIATTSAITDIQPVTNSLASKVDVIYIPTDNMIASNMSIIKEIAERRNVLLIGGESNHVKQGASITIGINYYQLGKDTAKMAVKILRDNISPKDIPSTGQSVFEMVINKKQLDKMGIIIPNEWLTRDGVVILN